MKRLVFKCGGLPPARSSRAQPLYKAWWNTPCVRVRIVPCLRCSRYVRRPKYPLDPDRVPAATTLSLVSSTTKSDLRH